MRPKLLISAILIAGLLGAGLALLIAYALGGTPYAYAALVAPVAATVYTCIFVYRHTSRRRALQAMLTALGTTSVVLLVIYLISERLR